MVTFFLRTENNKNALKAPTAQCNISKDSSGGRWAVRVGGGEVVRLLQLCQGRLPIRANTYDTLDSPAWTMAGDNRPLPAAQSMAYCPMVDVCRVENKVCVACVYVCISKHTYTQVKCQLHRNTIYKQHQHTLRKWLSAPLKLQIIYSLRKLRRLLIARCVRTVGSVVVVWGHLNLGDYRHYGNGHLLHCNRLQTVCVDFLSTDRSPLFLTCIMVWVLDLIHIGHFITVCVSVSCMCKGRKVCKWVGWRNVWNCGYWG